MFGVFGYAFGRADGPTCNETSFRLARDSFRSAVDQFLSGG